MCITLSHFEYLALLEYIAMGLPMQKRCTHKHSSLRVQVGFLKAAILVQHTLGKVCDRIQYVCIFLQHYRIQMDIDKSKNDSGIYMSGRQWNLERVKR